MREARVKQWETRLQRLGKPLPAPHQIAKASARNFFHCKLVYFGLFYSILVDFPASGRRPRWTLGWPILPATMARSLVFVPLCGMKFLRSLDLGIWSLEVPPCRTPSPLGSLLPASCSLLFRAFFILHSSFSHRGMDIDGPWQKIIEIISLIINHLRQNGRNRPSPPGAGIVSKVGRTCRSALKSPRQPAQRSERIASALLSPGSPLFHQRRFKNSAQAGPRRHVAI